MKKESLGHWQGGVPSGEGQKIPTQEQHLGEFTTPRTWMAQKLDLFSLPNQLVSGMLAHISQVHRLMYRLGYSFTKRNAVA